MITNPRQFVYRIYYNQATSSNDGTLTLVNWFDGNNLGLNTEPILSRVKNVYENFNGRNFIVPVAHVSGNCQFINQIFIDSILQSPPWIFINYKDPQPQNNTDLFIGQSEIFDNDSVVTFDVFGRDDSLLKVLARKMNFQFKYVDIQSIAATDNISQPGELGLQMIQRRVRDFRKSFY